MADGEITISELELSEELLADMVIPVETSTDTKSATLAQLRSWLGTSLPVGSIFASVGKIDDARFTLLDGKTLSATGTYAEFYLKAVEKVQAGKWQSCTEEEFNQEVSQYGQCMKFVISNDYVRIPKAGNSLYSANLFGADLLVAGNGSGLGLTSNGSNIGTLGSSTSGSLARAYPYQGTPTLLPSTTSGTIIVSGDKQALGITTDPTKSGIIAKTDTLGNNTIVYYYMVISTEGQTEPVDIDINQVYEDMELKANKNLSNVDANIDYVVESYQNGESGYRIWKSGYCEQWGHNYITGYQYNEVWENQLLKKYKDTNYSVQITFGAYTASDRSNASNLFAWSDNKTQTSFIWGAVAGNTGVYKFSGYWKTSGFLDEGEF